MKGSVYISPQYSALLHCNKLHKQYHDAALQHKPSLMFEIVAVVAVIREQWQTFQSLAHQASGVPAQKQSFRQQTTNNLNAGNPRMTRAHRARI